MLTEQEKKFMEYWEKNRLEEKKISKGLYVGLPLGCLFAAGILFSMVGGGWYQRAHMVANAQVRPIIFVIALVAIVVFISVFYKKFNWEQKEQAYQELRARLARSSGAGAADEAPKQS